MVLFIVWYIIGLVSLFYAVGFKKTPIKRDLHWILSIALFGPIILLVLLLDHMIETVTNSKE